VSFEAPNRPSSPDAFPSTFHFPPVPQYDTGTCWAFCSTSFFESEAARLSGRRVKLSEGSQDHGTQEVYRL
jgi:bleomycin hydrolase